MNQNSEAAHSWVSGQQMNIWIIHKSPFLRWKKRFSFKGASFVRTAVNLQKLYIHQKAPPQLIVTKAGASSPAPFFFMILPNFYPLHPTVTMIMYRLAMHSTYGRCLVLLPLFTFWPLLSRREPLFHSSSPSSSSSSSPISLKDFPPLEFLAGGRFLLILAV